MSPGTPGFCHSMARPPTLEAEEPLRAPQVFLEARVLLISFPIPHAGQAFAKEQRVTVSVSREVGERRAVGDRGIVAGAA